MSCSASCAFCHLHVLQLSFGRPEASLLEMKSLTFEGKESLPVFVKSEIVIILHLQSCCSPNCTYCHLPARARVEWRCSLFCQKQLLFSRLAFYEAVIGLCDTLAFFVKYVYTESCAESHAWQCVDASLLSIKIASG